MELRTFLITLGRYWWVPILTLAVALSGVFGYHRFTDQVVAASTIGVLDPFASRGSIAGEAQIDFADVVQSHQLAVRVAKRLGGDPDAISANIMVRVLPPPAGAVANASPVFSVSAKAKTAAAAIKLDNAVVQEAGGLYLELNTPDTAAYLEAIQPQFKSTQAKIDTAQAKLDEFSRTNSVSDLPTQVAKQRDLVSSLNINVIQAQADLAATIAANAGPQLTKAATNRLASLRASLTDAQNKLNTLTDLNPQYAKLTAELTQAQQVRQGLIQAQQLYASADRPPLPREIKVLDAAAIQSEALMAALTYVVGFVLGLLVGVTVVYLLAVFKRLPQTADEVSRAFGARVLVRIPKVVD